MPAAPLPPDERRRQENLELYQILDTLPEQQYDDLTFLAAQICGAPISLLTLVDRDRQWFKSHRGLDMEETPRELSFCAHAILDGEVLEVPDTAQDARFLDNELVTGATNLRFYAGAPLVTPEGFRLGTLCVADNTPRQLSPSQLESLAALSRQAMAQLELWRTVRRLQTADAARAQALSHLAANAALLREFVEHAPAAIAMLDRDLRYIVVSRRFLTDYDLAGRNLEGLHHYEVFPHIPQRWKETHKRVLAGAVERCEKDELVRPDGFVELLQWEVRPWRDARGQIGGLIMLTENITERVRAERVKNEFVSVVSHELRTPLTSIRGALGLLAGGAAGPMPPSAKQMLDIAQKNSDRLVLLINDILDIEKIESEEIKFDLHPLSLRELLENAREQNSAYGEPLGVRLVVENSASLDGMEVLGEESRLQQVLSNLLSNGCKFTPSGGAVHLSAQVRGEMVRVSVRDEGPGVSSEFVPRLFEKFTQADSSSTRRQGGTGLGLAIARAIVEKHGGILDYLPPLDGETGATFFFDLPLHAAPQAAIAPEVETSLPCILICEDDGEVAQHLRLIVEQNGYRAAIAPTLGEARDLLKREHYAGLLLDLLLPDGDGLELLAELRADQTKREWPVVVISAFCEEGQLRGEAFGVLDWISKPIDTPRLQAVLAQFRRDGTARVLHVEDDADVRRITAMILENSVQIVAATSLREARDLLKNGHFDLAILDIGLPDGNGLDLLPLLGACDPAVPVILFSASEPSSQQARSVIATLVKSRTDNQTLRETIQRSLNGKA